MEGIRLYTIRDICDATQAPASSVKKWIREHRLRALRLSRGCVRIAEEDFKQFLSSTATPGHQEGEE
jgi:excisionase family DNA binding protein